jgi:hypothetical protein
LLWHFRRNESHSDLIATALEALAQEPLAKDREMEDLLDELIGRETSIHKLKRMIRAWI